MTLTDLPPFASDPGAFDGLASLFDDSRPAPEGAALAQAGTAIVGELLDLLLGSALEERAGTVCEGLIGGLHSAALRLDRDADRARDRLAAALRDFDGSEVADFDLQAVRRELAAADAATAAVEAIRDAAAQAYAAATGECWSPWRGQVRASATTAAQLDAAEAIHRRASARAEACRTGPVVAFRGSPRAEAAADASRIFDALNWARSEWPDMALALTGAPGAERLAKRWAAQKHVPMVLSRADFGRHGRSAPFRANDQLLALEPVCVLTLAASLDPERFDRPFGPALDLAARARQAGVRCVAVAPRAAAATG